MSNRASHRIKTRTHTNRNKMLKVGVLYAKWLQSQYKSNVRLRLTEANRGYSRLIGFYMIKFHGFMPLTVRPAIDCDLDDVKRSVQQRVKELALFPRNVSLITYHSVPIGKGAPDQPAGRPL